jgi:hypothetical protein
MALVRKLIIQFLRYSLSAANLYNQMMLSPELPQVWITDGHFLLARHSIDAGTATFH